MNLDLSHEDKDKSAEKVPKDIDNDLPDEVKLGKNCLSSLLVDKKGFSDSEFKIRRRLCGAFLTKNSCLKKRLLSTNS